MQESVNTIIFNEARTQVLLVKRRDIPVWVLPGGGIEEGESPERAAVREAEEESGFQVAIVRKVAEYLPVNRLTRLTHVYECRILSGEPRPNQEASSVTFFPIERLPKLTPPPYPGWIQDALREKALLRKKIEGVSYWVLAKLLLLHPLLVTRFLLTKLSR